MPISDYYGQALKESQAAAQRSRSRQEQQDYVASAMPGLAKANPAGMKQHAAGLYAAMTQGQPAPGAQPAPSKLNSYRIQPDGTTQLQMLEQQNRGFNTGSSMAAEQDQGFQLPNGVMEAKGGIYANATPGAGYGNVLYSDTPEGAQGMTGFRGNFAAARGSGPFGRSAETQQRINDRVAQYQSAIDLIRSQRGVPSERERLQRQAGADISLNQGLGGFLNAAGRRNYARDQLKALDSREASQAESANEQARLGFDMRQKGIENLLEAEKVSQGRYKVQDAKYDPFGNQIQPASVFDTSTARFLNQGGGFQSPMSMEQATEQATREASERAGYFSSDKSDFGMDRKQWIEQRAKELMGQGGPAGQGPAAAPQTATDPRTGEKIQWNPDNQKWEPVK